MVKSKFTPHFIMTELSTEATHSYSVCPNFTSLLHQLWVQTCWESIKTLPKEQHVGVGPKRTSCCSAVMFFDSGWNGLYQNQIGEVYFALAPSCPFLPTTLAIGNIWDEERGVGTVCQGGWKEWTHGSQCRNDLANPVSLLLESESPVFHNNIKIHLSTVHLGTDTSAGLNMYKTNYTSTALGLLPPAWMYCIKNTVDFKHITRAQSIQQSFELNSVKTRLFSLNQITK